MCHTFRPQSAVVLLGLFAVLCINSACSDPIALFGCYADTSTNRTLQEVIFISEFGRTTTCVEKCRRKGFRFAGCKQANLCVCGDEVTESQRIHNKECYTTASLEPDYSCGSKDTMSVYDTQRGFMNILRSSECYIQNALNKLDVVVANSDQNTNYHCSVLCNLYGYPYSVTVISTYCMCGNFNDVLYASSPWTTMNTSPVASCSNKCAAAMDFPEDFCGAPNRLTLSYGYYAYGCYNLALSAGKNGVVATTAVPSLSAAQCVSQCGLEGVTDAGNKTFKLAAIDGSGACFCSDDFKLDPSQRTACTTKCLVAFETQHYCGGAPGSVYQIMSPASKPDCQRELCNDVGICTSPLATKCFCDAEYCGSRCQFKMYKHGATSDGRRLTVNWSTTMMLTMCAVWFVSAARCRLLTTWKMN